MAPRTRQARRSHANDATQSDELADTGASVLRTPSKGSSKQQDSSTIRKRRGRPPGSKNRPKTITKLSRTKRARSTRLGRSPGSAMDNLEPPEMTDKQIALALDMKGENPNTNHRVAQASKRVFRYTTQWPWQWAVRFLPKKKWGVNLVEDLAQLLGAIYQKSANTSANNGKVEIARRFLLKRARYRNQRCPQITRGDVIDALRYFEVETRRVLPDTQRTSQTTQPGRVSDLMGSDTESQPDEIPREDRDSDEDPIAAEDESEGSDNDEQSNEHEPVISTGGSARFREPMLSPTEDFHVEQRSQVSNPQAGQVAHSAHSLSPNITARAACRMSASTTTIFAGIINTIAPLVAEAEAEKETLTRDLSVLRQSIRDKEDAIERAVTATIQTELVDGMRETLRQQQELKEQTKALKVNFEQKLPSLGLTQDLISQKRRIYRTQILEWNETISRTKAGIQSALEEASKSNKEVIRCLEAQLEEVRYAALRVERDLKGVGERLIGYRLLLSLAELESPGISILVAKLERHELSLFDIIAEIRTGDQPR